ncbi:MAG: serine/threonine protein kinase [Deltaproteobacteria bacterium]|nr:serine/threonine protein kinase [Deltaproteobacteria bacterium]
MKLAAGGMATVYIGYLRGGLGFRQVVAIKRPHRHLLEDPAFRHTFVSEAHLASKLHHTNVVDVRDVDLSSDSVDLVMDYVEGASLSRLLEACRRRGATMPPAVALRIMVDACMGLHAAHEATDELGTPLGLVHRDVSPQNILVGIDGVTRVTDFGIAKCMHSGDVTTQAGTLKGKLGYMAPEYLSKQRYDRRADIFALGVVLWESLTMQRLFTGRRQIDTVRNILEAPTPRLDELGQPLGKRIDEVLEHVLHKDPEARFERANAVASALESVSIECGLNLTHRGVADFLREMAGEDLDARRAELRERLSSRASVVPEEPSPRGPAPDAAGQSSPSLPVAGSQSSPRISGAQSSPAIARDASRSSPGRKSRSSSMSVGYTQTESVHLPMSGPRVGWIIGGALIVAAAAIIPFVVITRLRTQPAASPVAASAPASGAAASATASAPPLASAAPPAVAASGDAGSAALADAGATPRPARSSTPRKVPKAPTTAPEDEPSGPAPNPYAP